MTPARYPEVLTWDGQSHTLELLEDAQGLHGTLTIRKPHGDLELPPIIFPAGITLQTVLSAWEQQHQAWIDWQKQTGDPFFATRVIDLGTHRIFWYVVHENGYPEDSWAVHAKPPRPDG